jgi:hypothetical protein
MKLNGLYLVQKLRMVELYLHSLVCIHGMELNELINMESACLNISAFLINIGHIDIYSKFWQV